MQALGFMMILVGMVACCRDSDTFCLWMRSIDQGEPKLICPDNTANQVSIAKVAFVCYVSVQQIDD